MKNKILLDLLIAVALLALLVESVHADDCAYTCSPQCIADAQKVLSNCLPKEAPTPNDVVRTCESSFMGEDKIQCGRFAKSANAVRTCKDVFFGRDQLTCAMSATDGDSVRACDEFISAGNKLKCAISGKSVQKIRACSGLSGSRELQCLGIN